jgi:hypothetical protein
MLRHAYGLLGVHVGAADVGHVHDLYFDDQQWVIRYVVIDTGHWFHHRRMLMAPTGAAHVDGSGGWVDLILTQGQVRSGPGADTDTPAIRPREAALFEPRIS